MRAWIAAAALLPIPVAVAYFLFAPAGAVEGPGPVSRVAAGYLSDALKVLERNHVNRGSADWVELRALAMREADGAATPADTHKAIRAVLERLGEKHSQLYAPPPPRSPEPGADAPRKPLPEPQGRLIDGRFGHVAVTRFNGSREQGLPYAERLRAFIGEFDAAGACGWIVDVRGNGGGNIWPMLDGIGPLLGGSKVLSFDIAGDQVYDVFYRDGVAVQAGGWAPRAPSGPAALRNPEAPVAVLMDGGTASSGEGIVIALAGRSNVRTFGQPTANYVSVNNVFPLEDGAALAVTMGWNRDRTGRIYRTAIDPDVTVGTEGEEPVATATAWLAEQPACRN